MSEADTTMHSTLPDSDVSILLDEATLVARWLHRRFNPPPADLEDIRQELLLDLIRRMPAFDPERGTLGAFAGVVLRNQTGRIAGRVARRRRDSGGPLLSLDTPGSDGIALIDRIAEDIHLTGWQVCDSSGGIEQRHDVSTALGFLSTPDRALCLALRHVSVARLVDHGFGSRAGIYRRLRELRFQLTALGLRAA